MAGTTVADGGAVEEAFLTVLDEIPLPPLEPGQQDDRRGEMLRYVRATMGTSKIAVFRTLLGSEDEAQAANTAFERAFDRRVKAGQVTALPDAEEAIQDLRRAGRRVALITGFSDTTRDAILGALGWSKLADLVLSPADAGRGRPYPDLVLHALLRLEIDSVASVAVAGDTAADITTGRAAGASILAGVLSGADDRGRLVRAGATHIFDSVADLVPIVLGSD
jgi:phosphoglycolate phosphatase